VSYFLLLFIPENSVLGLGEIWFWTFDCLSFVFFPLLIVYVVRRDWNVRVADIGLGWKATETGGLLERCLAMVVTFWLVTYGGNMLGMSLVQAFPDVLPRTFSYSDVLPESSFRRTLTIVYLAVSAGVSQELVFRGLPWVIAVRFIQRHRAAWYLAMSSVGFCLWHWDKGLPTVIAAAAIGLVAGIFFLRRCELVPLIVGHVAVDWYWL
jgi:membrane protease YdiL (CAAX protease family)